MQGPVPPGWWFDARLTSLLRKKKLSLRNPKKRNPDAIWQNLLRKIMAKKVFFWPGMMKMMIRN
jgi:hypothetical protein